MQSRTYVIHLNDGSHRNTQTGDVALVARRIDSSNDRERNRRYELILTEAEQERLVDRLSWWMGTPASSDTYSAKLLRTNQVAYLRSLADAIEKECGL